MMKRSTLLVAAAALVAVPAVAKADVTRQMCEYIGTGDQTCVRAKFVLTSGGGIGVYLFNGVGATSQAIPSSIQGFGIYNLNSYGGTWGLDSVYYKNFGGVSGNVSSDWSFTNSFPSLSVTLLAGADASGNGGVVTCAGPSGGSGTNYKTCDGFANPTFTGNQDWIFVAFSHTGGTALNTAALSTLEWGFRSQRVGPNGNSGQCSSAVGSQDYCAPGDFPDDPGGPNETVVPEPATMTLLATGLAGMAAARRRKKTA